MLDRTRLPDAASFYEAEGIELNGRGKWRDARCPLHGGKALRVNVESGAFCCMAGCELKGGDVIAFVMQVRGLGFVDAVKALGAWVDDGRDVPKRQQRASRLSARDRLEAMYRESLVVLVVGSDMHRMREISEADHARLGEAVARIGHVAWRAGD